MTHVRTQRQGSRIAVSGVYSLLVTLTAGLALAAPAAAQTTAPAVCTGRTVTADVVVFDQPIVNNRLGSQNVNGIMYALRRDVVNKNTLQPCGTGCQAGLVVVRPDKRPRPLVLRVAAGDCLNVTLTNLLSGTPNPNNAAPNMLVDDQVVERRASFHVQGLELTGSMQDDGSFVGKNSTSGLVAPGGSLTYHYAAPKEGTYLVTSHGAVFGSDGAAGNNANGMFAVVNVEPPGASFYRSQVTEEEMRLAIDAANPNSCAATATKPATPGYTCAGQPILRYEATYPATAQGTAVPALATSAFAPAQAIFVPAAQNPTTLAVPFPASGFLKLVAAGANVAEVFSYVIDPASPNGFTLTGTGTPSAATSAVFDPTSTSITTGVNLTALSARFPPAGFVTLIDPTGTLPSETFAYTIDPLAPTALLLDAGQTATTQTWPAGTTVRASTTIAGTTSVSVPLALAQPWPARSGVQNVDATGVAQAVGAPVQSVWALEGKAGLPILNMLQNNALVHSDLNAVVTGPGGGNFPASTYPLESKGFNNPTLPNRLEPFREYTVVFHDEAAVANAFPLWFAGTIGGTPNPLAHTLHAVGDVFQINYGSGAIGPEVIANRLGVGPMHDCLDCAYEEFFLTSPAVGDPAMLVDIPAVTGLEACTPGTTPGTGACAAIGPKATRAYFPDDPSNVHHSYISDHVKFRNVHTGKEHHIFHLHNHQWLFNPNDDNSNYMDAQGIGPGAGYTYEINFGGSGNRNKSAGDAIFHCHFYPHFAQGMWELWRNHDVFEAGTPLAVSAGGFHTVPFALLDGTPAPVTVAGLANARARSLPDGEIAVGTPIPALVPLPGKPMAPMPGAVAIVPKLAPDNATVLGSVARVDRKDTDPALVNLTATPLGNPVNPTGLRNPGFPFWLAGLEDTIGQRMPSPPLDMAVSAGGWDGGLPRHALDGYAASGCTPVAGQTVVQARAACTHSVESRLDMTKELKKAKAVWYPEDGNDVERAAMAFHSVRTHASFAQKVDGTVQAADFVTNGSGRPVAGAPFHEPCIDDRGKVLTSGALGNFFDGRGGTSITGSSPFNATSPRVYKGANIQFDAVLNKLGFHYPQERIGVLWEDAVAVITKKKPPEPFVMRMNTFDCVMYQHTNLVPAVYELDDYQIRTTTDIIGQHIHLPKWDLTTTDGSANGWNYEDGTLSPDSVRERIRAINAFNPAGLGNPVNSGGAGANAPLVALAHPFFGAVQPASIWSADGQAAWLGARTTLERWFSDPVVNVAGVHRGLGTIFTHDHFGPSTHQQIGLYATVLVEPPNSKWAHNETGVQLGDRVTVGDGGRKDGGPTSWQAAISPGDIDGDGKDDSYREFYFEYTDFQHAYKPGVYIGRGQNGERGADPDADTFRLAVNASTKEQAVGQFGKQGAFPDTMVIAQGCFGGVTRPCPEAISADDPGFFVVNYRNEPIGYRIYNPARIGPDGLPGAQTLGLPGDLAFAFDSRTDRAIPEMNRQPTATTVINGTKFPPPINASTAIANGDPFTPMMRAYYGDRIRMRIQAGGDEESHTVSVTGMKWLQSGSGYGFSPNSGWRNAQHAGISEQFAFASPAMPLTNPDGATQADYLYSVNTSMDGYWNGSWGLFRAYNVLRNDLKPLLNSRVPLQVANQSNFNGSCPNTAPVRSFDLTAVLANDVLGNAVGATIVPADVNLGKEHAGAPLVAAGGTLVFNPRSTTIAGLNKPPEAGGVAFLQDPHVGGVLHDPTAILYVRTADLVARSATDARCLTGGRLTPTNYTCPVQLRPQAPVEPIVLRAAAGDCIRVTLRNKLPAAMPDLPTFKHLPTSITRDGGPVAAAVVGAGDLSTFNNNHIRPSSYVGLRPQLVAHNVRNDMGMVVGQNPTGNIAAPGATVSYRWYAGDVSLRQTGTTLTLVPTPVEFGGTNLFPADLVKQGQKGLGGALVILPQGSAWTETDYVADNQRNAGVVDCSAVTPATAAQNPLCRETRTSATVNTVIRDFAAVIQKGMSHRYGDGEPVEQIAAEQSVAEDAEDSGEMALNYRSDPLWFRFGLAPNTPFTGPDSFRTVSNAGDAYSNSLTGSADPSAPVFAASAGAETRIHLLEPTGANRAGVITLHGHVWQRTPYVCPSSYLGIAGNCNPTSFYPTGTGTAITSTGLTGLGPMEVASRSIGNNLRSINMGAQDQIQPGSHFTLRLPSAGGTSRIPGDYLLMDRTGFGSLAGVWGILRVK
jgi:hypothetical protein